MLLHLSDNDASVVIFLGIFLCIDMSFAVMDAFPFAELSSDCTTVASQEESIGTQEVMHFTFHLG